MENKVIAFTSDGLGRIRAIDEDGKVLFVASDIAKALGYARPADAVSAHCRYTAKRSIPHPQGNGTLEVNVIPEGDMYRLITHSKLPKAQDFEKWVFDEVLPTIRKSGTYNANPVADAFMKMLSESDEAIVMRGFAGILTQNGLPCRDVDLFDFFRKTGYLERQANEYNMPTIKALRKKYFIVKVGVLPNRKVVRTPMITWRGIAHFLRMFHEIER